MVQMKADLATGVQEVTEGQKELEKSLDEVTQHQNSSLIALHL